MLRSVSSLLSARSRRTSPPRPRPAVPAPASGELRLRPPAALPAALGCDAVGVPARHGFRLLSRLPGNGCVFADPDWWWWLVPEGSDAELRWPMPAAYAAGARIPDRGARLIHRPGATSPYTPPIPLYLMACQLTGVAPDWTARDVSAGR
ncbi:hypothetical protein [Streptomyces sp. ODS05-4]|uniref:hypothetical protein n=1 Tax=Streptomyces sp. ODS05-4 TaxID=2944939 RepID=UPI002108A83C|nr:hypothetical protein [Streptomyces sp. ODS05-4]